MSTPQSPPAIPPADERPADSRSGAQTTCRRCGTCCQKGGPALHIEDAARVEQGKIPLRSLLTLRTGERVYDNVRAAVTVLDREVIRIKGRGRLPVCRFYDADDRSCRIYAQRPLECRVLTCWDTSAIERIYDHNRLVRKDLLGGVEGLWELIEVHESRCNHVKLAARIAQLKQSTPNRTLETAICESIAYDRQMRMLCVEKSGVDARLLDFLFGRPLIETIGAYGIAVRQAENGIRLRLRT